MAEVHEHLSSPSLAPPAHKRRILFAEDDSDIRRLMRAFLETEGYEVLSCGDGLRALEIFRNNQDIDLVITDIQMPHMSGTDLSRVLASTRPGLPVFLISGMEPEDHVLEWMKEHPHWKFFSKPLFLPGFLEAVHDTIAAQPSAALLSA